MDPRIRKAIVNEMIESIPQLVKLQVKREVAERTALELQIRSIKLRADTQAFSKWLKKTPARGAGGRPKQPGDTTMDIAVEFMVTLLCRCGNRQRVK